MRRFSIAMLAVLALCAGGCRDYFFPVDPIDPVDPVDPKPVAGLTGVQWCVESLERVDENTNQTMPVDVDPSLKMYAKFGEDGSVDGFGGCNGFGGEYKADPNTGALRFLQLWSTDMFCPQESNIEGYYFRILETAHSYGIDASGRLTIKGAAGTVVFNNCDTDLPPGGGDPSGGTMLALGEPFKLPIGGEGVKVEAADLHLMFDVVVSDDRASTKPNTLGVGNAKIIVWASKGGEAAKVELNTNANEGPTSARFQNYSISLLDLTPYPAPNVRIDPRGYVAVMKVTAL